MGSKVYVGGLPHSTTETEIETLFTDHGTVKSTSVITDKFTGQCRGFGFVEMSSPGEADAAIPALNATRLDEGTLTVREAYPMASRSDRGEFGVGCVNDDLCQ